MSRSYFTNPHGLPSDEAQYTTPADMARLARALIRDFPDAYKYYSEKSFKYNNIEQSNRNLLLWRDESFDGLKTGWTSAAGYNLVSSAKRNERRLIAVVMGIDAPNHQRGGIIRANESQALINWGIRFFESRKLFEGGAVLSEPRVYKGENTTVAAGLAEPFWVVLPQGQGDRLEASMELHGPHMAPLAAGDALGEVVVTLRGEVLARQPLVALEAVDSGGMFRWLWDSAALALRAAWPF
jgi:serine-type D-Ala-D-Ala carboxypeptidase (penicillin-binding protein 5/6)